MKAKVRLPQTKRWKRSAKFQRTVRSLAKRIVTATFGLGAKHKEDRDLLTFDLMQDLRYQIIMCWLVKEGAARERRGRK